MHEVHQWYQSRLTSSSALEDEDNIIFQEMEDNNRFQRLASGLAIMKQQVNEILRYLKTQVKELSSSSNSVEQTLGISHQSQSYMRIQEEEEEEEVLSFTTQSNSFHLCNQEYPIEKVELKIEEEPSIEESNRIVIEEEVKNHILEIVPKFIKEGDSLAKQPNPRIFFQHLSHLVFIRILKSFLPSFINCGNKETHYMEEIFMAYLLNSRPPPKPPPKNKSPPRSDHDLVDAKKSSSAKVLAVISQKIVGISPHQISILLVRWKKPRSSPEIRHNNISPELASLATFRPSISSISTIRSGQTQDRRPRSSPLIPIQNQIVQVFLKLYPYRIKVLRQISAMAGKVLVSGSTTDAFEYLLFEGDPDHLKSVICSPNQISPWIDPNALKLSHRIGRGPFGDVWLATHHHSSDDYDRYHEVAVKMIYPVKDDQIQGCLTNFDEIFSQCQGLKNVCFLHGVSIHNGRVCIVMKFYEGSVGDKMSRLKGGRLSLSDVLRYGADLAQGILELHSRGILVLNLKPCNFLLDEHDQAILGDVGIPYLLFGLSHPNPDIIQRLGTPNYMAPEQWQPEIRGPISFETDSWSFGCSILEMLSGSQLLHGKSPDEIYHLVVTKQERPPMPTGLPPKIENVLWGCFEYDLRNRPLMADILEAFISCRDEVSSDDADIWSPSESSSGRKSTRIGITDWFLLKDHLQVGDKVRSRNPNNSCKPVSMMIPEGTIVGIESEADPNSFILVSVRGFHNPLRVHPSTVERVTFGFSSGDWVRVKDEEHKKHCSSVGILHSIDRDGNVKVGFIGMKTLWNGKHSELQMAESYCVGQFLRIKAVISCPRFDWPRKQGGGWATGKISQILPNGCLVVKFPSRFSFGEASSCLADPSEVEVVSFGNCEGVVKKYEHLEDFHWVVRPMVIALSLFAALKFGFFVGKNVGKLKKKKKDAIVSIKREEKEHQHAQRESNQQWLPPSVANIIFRESGVN